MISVKDVVRRKEDIPWRMIEDEAVLVEVKKGEVIHCNPVGAFIWGRLEGTKQVSALVTDVVENFEVDEETASKDTLEFIGAMEKKGLLVKE